MAIVRLQVRIHFVQNSIHPISVSNAILVMNSMSITFVKSKTCLTIPLVPTLRTVSNVTLLNVQSVRKVSENSSSQRNVFYRQQTALKDARYAHRMNVSCVMLDTHHSHGLHVLTVRLCLHETQRVNARPYNQTVLPFPIVDHVLLMNVLVVRQDLHWIAT